MSMFSNLFSKLNLVDVAAKAESAVAEIEKLKSALEAAQAKLAEVEAYVKERKNVEFHTGTSAADLLQKSLNDKIFIETADELLEKKIEASK